MMKTRINMTWSDLDLSLSRAFLRDLNDPIISHLLHQLEQFCHNQQFDELYHWSAQAREFTYDKLHSDEWRKIRNCYRIAYGWSCLFHAIALLQLNKSSLSDILQTLDMGILMCGGQNLKQLQQLLARIQQQASSATLGPAPKRQRREEMTTMEVKFPIPRVEMPSLMQFLTEFLQVKKPVIITGAMDLWPALGKKDVSRAWSNPEYLRKVAGLRTVPVEIGSSYLHENWGQKLMLFSEFLDRFIYTKHGEDKEVGYLAQHQLFDQIEELRSDVMVPDYCALSDGEIESTGDVKCNAWYGPANTISPLHFDPEHNLLCQVVGSKYIRLYDPQHSAKLYPVEGLLSNTSRVEVDDVDEAKFPQFSNAPYLECILGEGEMLYIPPKHWHYVRSLSTSFSVRYL